MNLVGFDYINERDAELTKLFCTANNVKKYILGINKLTKSILKYITVDGIIDDFTRVQSSRKKSILKIDEIDKNSIILTVSTGSPLEVKIKLDEMGLTHFNYLSFFRYSNFDLIAPPFMLDFEDDFKDNISEYEKTYTLLADKKSKEVFEKVINFKMTFDYTFMQGFTNNHEEQYFDKELIPAIKKICFIDGGGYVGDTIPYIIENFPDFEKIYCIEPSDLHINIAKRNFHEYQNIEFINCGLGNKKKFIAVDNNEETNNCNHNYQANNINTIDNLITKKVDFIKLDIEGAEQDAIEGAQNTIKNHSPILAICIYHKAQDWYKVPQKVLEINPNYDIYLRHYMEGIFETVMYFIPKMK